MNGREWAPRRRAGADWVVVLVVGLLAGAAGCGGARRSGKPDPGGSWPAPVVSVEVASMTPARRARVRTRVREAVALVGDFARRYRWERAFRRVKVRRVEVVPTRDRAWRRILDLAGLPETTPLPTDGFAAGCEAGVCVVVQPSEYARLRPEYARQAGAWMRLLAHEFAHRLHVRILGGDEDAMGPRWFFEGFAILAAGQRLPFRGTFGSIREAVNAAAGARGRGSYAVYGAALRHLLGRVPLPTLVRHAREPGFEDWVRGL